MALTGISDSLIASVIYLAANKIWHGLNEPVEKSIAETAAYFSNEKQIEITSEGLRKTLSGQTGSEEMRQFLAGEKFISSETLALQFIISDELYTGDQCQLYDTAHEIFSYFKSVLEKNLLSDPAAALPTLKSIQTIFHRISSEEHQIITEKIVELNSEIKQLSDAVGSAYNDLLLLAEKEKEREKYYFEVVDEQYWEGVKNYPDSENIVQYYTRTDSRLERLQQVVLHEFHIANKKADYFFAGILNQAVKNRFSLIKILSRGGEGKSTFIHHISRKYYTKYHIVFLKELETDGLSWLEYRLAQNTDDLPVILVLDNPAVYIDKLPAFFRQVAHGFRKYRMVTLVAEREFRYSNMRSIREFESVYDEVYQLDYKNINLRKQIFRQLMAALEREKKFSDTVVNNALKIFLEEGQLAKRKSISECIYTVIRYLKQNDALKFQFDWEDWDNFTQKNCPDLRRLYLVVATFYQFGYSLDIDFCADFLKRADAIDIEDTLSASRNLPICLRGKYLSLRHETLADWYLDDSTPETAGNRKNSRRIFKDFLDRIDTAFSKDLFIWISKNKDFRRSYLSRLLDDKKQTKILEDFITENPKELKCRTELSKIYQQQKKWDEAEKTLMDLLELDSNNLQARTELSKIYQQQKKWDEAEKILMDLLELDSNNLQARTELSKIYQQQKKWDEAVKPLKEYIALDPQGLHPRTELSKIYQQQKKWDEAEKILMELLKLDSNNLQARTELSKIYQQQKKWDEAVKPLKEYIALDPQGLHPRTELSKIYQQQKKWDEAEKILMELLKLDSNNLQARTELSKIYQQQKKWDEAEKILMESLEIDPEQLHPRTELSKIYQQQKKWDEAEKILMESLKIDPEQLHPRTELSKIYQQQKKWDEAEKILMELLEFDSNNLQARTELSKIYQQQKKWDEAEEVLHQCLEINPDDITSLLELGKILAKTGSKLKDAELYFNHILSLTPDDLYAKTELSILYTKTRQFHKREKILFDIYETHPDNIPNLMNLSRMFVRFRKYRVAIKLLKKALELDNSDLLTITELMKVYAYVNGKKNVSFYKEKGEEIIAQEKYVRNKGRFRNATPHLYEDIELLDLMRIGYWAEREEVKKITSSKNEQEVFQYATVNNQVKNGTKVYYGLYSHAGKTVANFVEPYFEKIDDLWALK
ncbi:MAG: tetratricopeptide repeat protein [Candidatus Electrothrix sp. Rat3]|nr:tetratricopeptide repeat protein [Candidatus Electrothrix rattekaaiensis]